MNRDYALPGFVAMALVVLYPIYWLVALNAGFSSESLFEAFRADAERLDLWDVLFVAIGVMEITVYLSLRNLLKERLNSDLASALLMLMAIFVALFTVIVVFDLVLALGPDLAGSTREAILQTALVSSLSTGYLLAWVSLILAVALLVNHASMDWTLMLFALLLLISSLLNISILLAPLSVLTYPLAFLMLALHFLRGGHEVEVV